MVTYKHEKTIEIKPQKSNGLWGSTIYLALFTFCFVYVYTVTFDLLEKSLIRSELIR